MITERQSFQILCELQEHGNISSRETLMKKARRIAIGGKTLVVSCDLLGDCLVGVAVGYEKSNGGFAKLFVECTDRTFVIDENSLVDKFWWDYLAIV